MNDEILEKIAVSGSQTVVECRGIKIPVSYQKGTTNALIVLFHGAIRRDVRKFPFYEKFLPVNAHQISIADPALLTNKEIVSSWYLGREGTNQPTVISDLVQKFSRYIGCRRTIYLGGSAGGFASLLYSSLHPGSLAVAVSPQTRLQTYQNPYVEVFRKSCWPSTTTADEIALSNLGRLYQKGFKNTAVIVLSAGDFGHVYTQFFPFVQNLSLPSRERFVMDIGYWNIPRHAGSVPRHRYMSWIKAALSSPSLNASDLLDWHYRITDSARPVAPMSDINAVSTPAPDPADIRRADLLRELALKS